MIVIDSHRPIHDCFNDNDDQSLIVLRHSMDGTRDMDVPPASVSGAPSLKTPPGWWPCPAQSPKTLQLLYSDALFLLLQTARMMTAATVRMRARVDQRGKGWSFNPNSGPETVCLSEPVQYNRSLNPTTVPFVSDIRISLLEQTLPASRGFRGWTNKNLEAWHEGLSTRPSRPVRCIKLLLLS